MERPSQPPEAALPPCSVGSHAIWLVLLAGLIGWQVWLTLGLFGTDDPVARLFSSEPIVSGRHPLHLYHGWLGARSLIDQGCSCCYDPAFQAGYPKTPVFDSGCRPAEWFMLLAGGEWSPAAYKLGLAICCLMVPLILAVAARAMGLSRAAAFFTALLGMLVWWGVPCQSHLAAGRLDLLLASLAGVLNVCLLVRFDRSPCLLTWVGVLLSGYLAWFAHPVVAALQVPLALLYYLSIGHRHALLWHVALVLGLSGAVGANVFWLWDWIAYWWIRAPVTLEPRLLTHRTFSQFWQAPLWGEPADRTLAVALLVIGAIGVLLLNERKRRTAARLLGVGSAGALILAIGGAGSDSLAAMGTPLLLVPSLLFAVLPTVHALAAGYRQCVRWTGGWHGLGAMICVGLLAIGVGTVLPHAGVLLSRLVRPTPLSIGLDPERSAVVEAIRTHTTSAARVLWEDRTRTPGGKLNDRWSVLLPLLTERAFVGGLDPEAGIEHTATGLIDELLVGRPIDDWTDAELDDFARRYNIGWVVCWSVAARRRLEKWPAAHPVTSLSDEGRPGQLFRLERTLTYTLRGEAEVVSADAQHIALKNVRPADDGVVVLSMHYQAGMRAAPAGVQIEREIDPIDLVPFLRLRLTGPAARVLLTWDGLRRDREAEN